MARSLHKNIQKKAEIKQFQLDFKARTKQSQVRSLGFPCIHPTPALFILPFISSSCYKFQININWIDYFSRLAWYRSIPMETEKLIIYIWEPKQYYVCISNAIGVLAFFRAVHTSWIQQTLAFSNISTGS